MKHVYTLIVEDSIYSADLNVRELKRAGFAVEYKVVASRSALRDAIRDKQWDIILSDHNMPGFDSLQALEVINQMGCSTPFIIVSEDISDKELKKALEQGCIDCVRKEHLHTLGKRVSEILELE